MRDNGDRDEAAVAAQLDSGPGGGDAVSRVDARAFVAAGGQSGGLAGGVDTAQLHGHRCDSGQAQRQGHDHRGDAQGRFDGAGPGTVGYTLVLSARPMTFVSAATTEWPVTTL